MKIRYKDNLDKERRDILVKGLKGAGWEIESPAASMFAWAKLPDKYIEAGSMEFSKLLLEKADVAVAPGIGFGKTAAHNVALLRALPRLERELGRPLLLGLSRKSLIPALLGRELPAAERDQASHHLHAQLFDRCSLMRVHDVAGASDARKLCLEALR